MPELPAETIFTNGHILTGAGLQPADPTVSPAVARCLAVRDGRVLAVGDTTEVMRWRGSTTRLVDLHGAFAMPGFNDAHVHLGLAGQHALALDLRGSLSLPDMLHQLEQYSRSKQAGEWLLGGGWDQTRWAGATLPTRHDLDAVTGDRPTILRRVDAHIAVANSAALGRAGIAIGLADPAGARIDRDRDGHPTGILREAAATDLVDAVVPPPNPRQRRQGLRLATNEAAAHGVTSLQDNSDWEDFPVLQAMQRDGDLPVRVAEWMDFHRSMEELDDRRRSQPNDDPWLHLTHLKGFLDGSLGSRTAALLAPYTDDPGNRGLLRYDEDHLLAMTRERIVRGFSIAFHAIGDRANRIALNVLEQALAGIPGAQHLRCRIEHAQVVSATDRERFAPLGVIASMQPCHLLGDLPWVAARLGPQRSQDAYAWRSLLSQRASLAFGTDFPVESVNPLRGLYSAITRQSERGPETFQLQERLTLPQALYAYTQAPAHAEFRETSKGRLEPGFVADLVVLSRNPLLADPAELLEIHVERTVVGGTTVFPSAGTADAQVGPGDL